MITRCDISAVTKNADAADSDIYNGKTAFVNGVKRSGTLVFEQFITPDVLTMPSVPTMSVTTAVAAI